MMWGTDATMAWTKKDGWVWAFCCIDHYSCEAWTSVAKRGDRFASLEPIHEAVTDRFGRVDKNLAGDLSTARLGTVIHLGALPGSDQMTRDRRPPAFAGEPPCNGCPERFIRTLKEQCLWARLYEDIEDLRTSAIEFTRSYNHEWLIERHGHKTPREAYANAIEEKAA